MRSYLEQLVKEGRLKQFLHQLNGPGGQTRLGFQGNAFSRAPLGTINIIYATLGKMGSQLSRVMSLVRPLAKDSRPKLKRVRVENRPSMSFFEENKVRTVQPHDDALIRISALKSYCIMLCMILCMTLCMT